MKILINITTTFFSARSMKINASKCFYLHFALSVKNLTIINVAKPTYHINNHPIPGIGYNDFFKYLGVQFNSSEKMAVNISKVSDYLHHPQTSPLESQQKLFMLREYLIPKLYHQLILGRITIGLLKQIDLKIRQSIQAFLHLQHFTPDSFFYTSIADDGLGIPQLQFRIPGFLRFRLKKLNHSKDIITSLSATNEIQSLHSKCLSIFNLEATPSKADLQKQINKQSSQHLYSTVDGKGLQETRKFPLVNHWIRGGTRLMHGNYFIHSIQLHVNQLPTREQATRGGRPGERVCRGCKNYMETLSHILQKCPRTHGLRIQRHDSITRLIADECIKRGWQVTWEPRIRTSSGLKKPDLIISKEYKTAIVDVTIVWDSPEPLETTYQDKLDLYDQPSIRAHIAEAYGSNKDVQFGAIVISPRRAWCYRNEAVLSFLDLPKNLRDILVVRSMEKSYKIYRTFMKIT